MALTAKELAAQAGVTPQTASGHLARMTRGAGGGGHVVTVERQSRHRYCRLALPRAARGPEELLALPGRCRRKAFTYPWPTRCGHAAAAVLLRSSRRPTRRRHADALKRRGFVHLDDGIGRVLGEGRRFLAGLGIDINALAGASPRSARPASTARSISTDARVPKSWALRVSGAGERGFAATFRYEVVWLATASRPHSTIAIAEPGNDFWNSAEDKPQEALRSA